MSGYHDEELTWTCNDCGEICERNTYATMVTILTGEVTKAAEDGRVIDVEPQFPVETEQLCYLCFDKKYKEPVKALRSCLAAIANTIELMDSDEHKKAYDKLNDLVVYIAGVLPPKEVVRTVAEDSVEAVAEGPRWINQLIGFYKKIVEDPSIPVENLDKANEAVCRCIEELRPLTEAKT
jgi:hypothetical protein